MCYCTLCFARGQQFELPGYDHNIFAENVDENHATKDLFTKEYNYLRKGTILMFNGFNSDAMELLFVGLSYFISTVIVSGAMIYKNTIFEE